MRMIPPGSSFILVNDDQWGEAQTIPDQRVIPFLERDGQYWGPPADDETAIRELERLHKDGASHIAFAWPSFWWLEHFLEFRRYLWTFFPCVLENERVIVFRLEW